MKILIIVAHGSKIQSSNDEIKLISNSISTKIDKENYFDVKYSFLELAKPSFEDILMESCKLDKINEITIFPYFLAAGKHVKTDIPEIVNHCKNIYKNINFKVLPHFGICNGIEDLIINNS